MRGAEALFLSIFGESNKWGRLPITLYESSIVDQLNRFSFNMTEGVGRTYRYYKGTPVYPFGYGLSYSTFSLYCHASQNSYHFIITNKNKDEIEEDSNNGVITIHCRITNQSNIKGNNVLTLYHRQRKEDMKGNYSIDHPIPFKSLINFGRYEIESLQSKLVKFPLSHESFLLTNSQGKRVLYNGLHYFDIYDGLNTVSIGIDISSSSSSSSSSFIRQS